MTKLGSRALSGRNDSQSSRSLPCSLLVFDLISILSLAGRYRRDAAIGRKQQLFQGDERRSTAAAPALLEVMFHTLSSVFLSLPRIQWCSPSTFSKDKPVFSVQIPINCLLLSVNNLLSVETNAFDPFPQFWPTCVQISTSVTEHPLRPAMRNLKPAKLQLSILRLHLSLLYFGDGRSCFISSTSSPLQPVIPL
ncbi:hypothetical protein AVEN_57960-1 [Araneus ventricosus]|uniref:Uncharacterized protein n=1 Tax=Araneus ventricosus TaxID=182803 RepID=A0A4Y2N300_ARAVE|nr:hypothetical protein AVEN_192220-1 [Araneus ventricosus]GBN32557.1 hypothetical protein AVEN_57960-1 [Araneus ventricosus]